MKKIPWSIIIAIIGLVFGINYVINSNKTVPRPAPLVAPANKTPDTALVGTGLVESAQENIAVMPYRMGKITAMLVREGDHVQQGQVLYRLDTQAENAHLQTLQANMASQQATLVKLQHSPRPEDVNPAKATAAQNLASYNDQLTQLKRLEAVTDPGAISQDELTRKRYAVKVAKAQLDQANQEVKRLNAGTWVYDIRKTQADIRALSAQVHEQNVQLTQSVVTAPRAGTVLQVNTRVGEVVSTAQAQPPVLLGNTGQLQVRVDIDEVNANLVKPGMPAMALLRGNTKQRFKLNFDRIIPYMVPKKNLSGAAAERVDVRVLQMVYTFPPQAFPVYVGQQVDVYLFEPGKSASVEAALHPKAETQPTESTSTPTTATSK
jgi:HlyD family secretion protein